MMRYEVETAMGDLLASFEDLDEAILDAKQRLRDDPEAREFNVYDSHEGRYVGSARTVPDANWQSVVGWLWEGERVSAPAGLAPMSDAEFEEMVAVNGPYADDCGKREGLRQMREGGWV